MGSLRPKPVAVLLVLVCIACGSAAQADPVRCTGSAPGAALESAPGFSSGPAPGSSDVGAMGSAFAGLRGWPATIGENFGTPMFADLNGDGRMEVVAVDRQGTYVFDLDGNLLPGWPVATGEVNNTPAAADLDEDGTIEIFVASAGAPPRIHCLHLDGSPQPGFPVSLPYQYWLNVSAPVVEDVDGDGHLDVGAQSEPGVAFFDRFGSPLPGWPYLWTTQQNIVWSAPAVADLDGDGTRDVVVGTNCLYDCAVHVIRADGTAMPGWPRPTRNVFSSAAVGDLDRDGDLEIVIQEGDPTWYGGRMHVWHHDGTSLAGWPRSISDDWEGSRSNAAIVDLNNDGALEIVTATGDARLHVLRPDGTEFAGYPRVLPGGAISSVQVIDVDNDRVEEIFLCYWAGGSQWVSGWRLGGTTLNGFPKVLYASSELDAHSSAHVADADGDGVLELCAQGGTFGGGKVWVYEVDQSTFQPSLSRADWPKIRHDARNTGRYARSDPALVQPTRLQADELACFPNPAVAGRRVRLCLPGSGALLAVDASGRLLSRCSEPAEVIRELDLGKLLGTSDRPGVYFLRWIPDDRVTAPSAFRLTVVPAR